MTEPGWQFWIDRGGTFTDVVARDPHGQLHVHKLLSRNPGRYEDPALQGIHDVLKQHRAGGAAPTIAAVKMGTTLATNALLERTGAPVVLVVTTGFADLLRIGYQDRPDLFALQITKPAFLAASVVEAAERVLADGTVRTPLDESALRVSLLQARASGIDAVAILFLHSYAHPAHELAAGRIARELGFSQVSLSHEVANEIKAVGRGDTTVADAYLTPLLRDYVDQLHARLGPATPLRFMQSNGGLTPAGRFRGKNAVLSGPAGGVVACAHVAREAGIDRVIGFDMGGTSTDVSRFDGRFERVFETRVAGVRLKAPMMHIETVAAGGGSILRFEQGRFTVGPASAGADPGPACYRRGGPATVTDANLVLGRIQPEYFPACFGPDGNAPLDRDAARARLSELSAAANAATGEARSVEETAAGFLRIANEHMAEPIKTISVARGYDPREHALVCFGGAGAQHACALAARLGMRQIVLHPLAGVFSAFGMGLADAIHTQVLPVLSLLDDDSAGQLDGAFAAEEKAGAGLLREEGFADTDIAHERSLDLRYQGVEASLNVVLDGTRPLREAFEAQHKALYGFTKPDHPIEVVALRVDSMGRTHPPATSAQPEHVREVTPERGYRRG
jgi:5-oxoprolinase (ATP-hydrolysing)